MLRPTELRPAGIRLGGIKRTEMKPAAWWAVLAGAVGCLAIAALVAFAPLPGEAAVREAGGHAGQALVVRDSDGQTLATLPLTGTDFALSYRNSIYHTVAEERFTVQPNGEFDLRQLAADQLAVLEEYYFVPDPPVPAPAADRRTWLVPPNPEQPAHFDRLSIGATDLGERTVHIAGSQPVALWQLVDDADPFVDLTVELTAELTAEMTITQPNEETS